MWILRKLWQRLMALPSFQPGEVKLLQQYWRMLEARLRQFECRQAPNDPIVSRLHETLSGTPNWDSAFRADLLVPMLLQGKEIDIEFASRMDEAKTEWPKTTTEMQKAYEDRWKAVGEGDKRALLQALVNESLWQYAVLDQERNYRGKTIFFSAMLFVLSLSFLSLALWGVDNQVVDLHSWSGSWWMVALAGWAGASFSWLTRMRDTVQEKNLNVLKELSRWHYSLSRAFIGVGAAVVLYWALRGGFISGAVFPVLEVTRSEERLTKVTQAFRAIAYTATSCAPEEQEKNRNALLASSVENFRALLLVHERERRQTAGDYLWARTQYLDINDGEWLLRAGLRPAAAGPPPGTVALRICDDRTANHAQWTIRNALLTQSGTLALLLFWSFVAGFSEKLVPSILDGASERPTS